MCVCACVCSVCVYQSLSSTADPIGAEFWGSSAQMARPEYEEHRPPSVRLSRTSISRPPEVRRPRAALLPPPVDGVNIAAARRAGASSAAWIPLLALTSATCLPYRGAGCELRRTKSPHLSQPGGSGREGGVHATSATAERHNLSVHSHASARDKNGPAQQTESDPK